MSCMHLQYDEMEYLLHTRYLYCRNWVYDDVTFKKLTCDVINAYQNIIVNPPADLS